MEIDANFYIGLITAVVLLTLTTYFYLQRKNESTSAPATKKQNRRKKKAKETPVEGVNSLSQLQESVLHSSPEDLKKVIHSLLAKIPKENWPEVIPSLDTENVIKLAEKDSEINKMNIQIHSLQARLANAEEEVDFSSRSSKGVVESFQLRVTSLQAEIARLQDSIRKSGTEHESSAGEWRRRLDEVSKGEKEAQRISTGLRRENSELETKYKSAVAYNGHEVAQKTEKLMVVLKEEIAETNRKLVVANNTVERLRSTVDPQNMSKTCEQLEDKLATKETKVDQLTCAVTKLTNERQEMELTLAETTHELNRVNQDIAKLAKCEALEQFEKLAEAGGNMNGSADGEF